MVSENVSELIEDLRVLLAVDPPAADAAVDVSDAETIDEVQFRLDKYFSAESAPAAVNLVVGEIRVGVVTLESLRRSGGTMAEPSTQANVGAGEGLELPGTSTRYALLRFTCPKCAPKYRIYYDERTRPACEHGKMKFEGLRREA